MGRRRKTRGSSTLIEIPLVFSLYCGVVLGILTVGYLVFSYNSLAFMAQQGARWASVHGSASGSPATSTSVSNFVLTQGVGLTNAVTVTTTWTPDNKPGSSVKVDVTYNAAPLAWNYISAALGLHSSCTLPISR
jgi:hypothetical protein